MLALAALVLFLFRPIAVLPPAGSRDAVVPVLVDVSRSMRLADADGQTRLARADGLLKNELGLPLAVALQDRDVTASATASRRSRSTASPPTRAAPIWPARSPPCASAIAASASPASSCSRTAAIPGRGQDRTGQEGRDGRGDAGGPPVFAVGIGSPDGPRDREVLGITAGDPRLDHATVDLHVTAVSSGFGRAPFSLRVLANGQLLDTRRLVPPADGSPIDQVFTVSPDPLNATVYTAEIPRDEAEAVGENNSRSLLVSPAGRKRRVLAGRRRARVRAQLHDARAGRPIPGSRSTR